MLCAVEKDSRDGGRVGGERMGNQGFFFSWIVDAIRKWLIDQDDRSNEHTQPKLLACSASREELVGRASQYIYSCDFCGACGIYSCGSIM